MEGMLLEYNNIKAAAVPTDINLAALVGSNVEMISAYRCAITLSFSGSAAANVVASVEQYDGSTYKALELKNPILVKKSAAAFFSVAADAAGDLNAELADDAGVAVIEILAEELDSNNGFNAIRVNLEAAGEAKIVSALYELHDTKQRPAYKTSI